MKRVINLDNWNRKEHFKFFSALDDPFWGITTTVDFTSVYQQSKNMEVSFFLYSVYPKSIRWLFLNSLRIPRKSSLMQ